MTDIMPRVQWDTVPCVKRQNATGNHINNERYPTLGRKKHNGMRYSEMGYAWYYVMTNKPKMTNVTTDWQTTPQKKNDNGLIDKPKETNMTRNNRQTPKRQM